MTVAEANPTAKHAPAEPPPGWKVGLKTVDSEGKAHGGFPWPIEGPWPKRVECPDWDPKPECGNGLHLLGEGEGDTNLLSWDNDAKWLAVAYDPVTEVDLEDKIKVPYCLVLWCADRSEIGSLVLRHNPGKQVPCGQSTASGYKGQSTASGYKGQSTASGVGGQSTASGYRGQSTASGDYGQSTASGVGGQSTASGVGGQSTASGYRGQSTASGVGGQSTASGDYGQSTASGYKGQSTASGVGGLALASGRGGVAAAGDSGILAIRWWDRKADRHRLAVAYVGEDGIEANVAYRLDDQGKFVKV